MPAAKRVHSGLILAVGLLGVSVGVLILGASRDQATDAGLPGSVAPDFSLRDAAGTPHGLKEWVGRPLVLIVARRDAGDFDKPAAEANQILKTFEKDDSARVVGVQVTADTGLLTDAEKTPGVLQTACPGLAVLQDTDGTLARAYRVDRPTAVVVGPQGVIRARVPLDHDGAAVAVADTLLALRPTNDAAFRLRN